MSLVSIAALRRPRGIKGELVATPLTDFPERFADLNRVYVGGKEFMVERTWWHGADIIFKFSGIDSMNDAQPLAGKDVEIPEEERVPLPEGEYYLSDLMGCEVFDRDQLMGKLTGWQELPGQILLTAGGVDFPYKLVQKVDLENRRIDVDLPEGLRDLNS